MGKFIKIVPIFFVLIFIANLNAAKKTHKSIVKWRIYNIIDKQTTYLNTSEKALKSAINRLKKLYDTQKPTFAELNTKCTNPTQPISPRGIKTLQKLHIVNQKGEIYDCYKRLVPLVFKITKINPPKSRFVTFEELIKTGMITKEKKE